MEVMRVASELATQVGLAPAARAPRHHHGARGRRSFGLILRKVGGAQGGAAAAAVDAALDVGSKRRARVVKRFEGGTAGREAQQRNFRVAVVRPVLAPVFVHGPPPALQAQVDAQPALKPLDEGAGDMPAMADAELDFGEMDTDMGAADDPAAFVPESPTADAAMGEDGAAEEEAPVEEGVANERGVSFAPGTGSLATLEEPAKAPRARKPKFTREAAAQRQSLAGLRRSSRRRIAPLQYWRGEKKEYERKYMSLPTVSSFKKLEPFSPSDWNKPKRRARTNAGGAKKTTKRKGKTNAATAGGATETEAVQTTPTGMSAGASGSPTPGPIVAVSRLTEGMSPAPAMAMES